MSKKIITNRGEYPVIFCAAINDGVLMEIEDDRPLYTVAEEFDTLESLVYEYQESDVGRTYDCPLAIQMIQVIDDRTKQIRLVKAANTN